MDYRECTGCRKSLPLTAEFFHRSGNGRGLGGFQPRCKDCRRTVRRLWNQANAARKRENERQQGQALRLEVLAAYCDGTPRCQCCGEGHVEFLALDHREEDGAAQRRELAAGKQNTCNRSVYRWARRNGYPPTLQVLCHNCNRAKHIYGECPHERARREAG